MKRLLTLCACVVLSAGALSAADTLTIVHMNDTHSNLAPGGRRTSELKGTLGGIARAASLVGYMKMMRPNVVTVHGGDLFIGDLFFQRYFGVAELRMLGAIGVDVMTLGNHEFDLTPQTLITAYDTAFVEGQPFPIVSANVVMADPAVQKLATYVTPHTIKQVGNIKVGFFGLTTPETNLLSLPAPVVIDTSIVPIAIAEITTLRAQGCDVVILLSHLGRAIDEKLSAYLTGIDLIIGAHSHETITDEGPAGSNIPIVQGAPFYHGIGVATLLVDGSNVSLLGNMVVPMDESIPEAPQLSAAIETMIADIESVYGPVYTTAIATATEDIEELAEDLDVQGDHDTPLGNLTTDAFRVWGGTEIAIEPGGSVAQPLYEGPLVTADAFRAISYGFNMKNGLGYRMARFSVLGAEIMAGLEFGIMDLGSDEFMSQVSGMSYAYDPNRPPTQRLVEVMVGEAPMDPMRRYTVTANEFVVLFFNVLGITPQDVAVNEDTTETMVLAGYIAALQTVSPEISGRVKASATTSVQERPDSDIKLFDVVSVNGQALVDLNCTYMEDVTVDMYTVNLRHIPIPTEIVRGENGVQVRATTSGLESGMYIMRVKIGDCITAGRVIVTK